MRQDDAEKLSRRVLNSAIVSAGLFAGVVHAAALTVPFDFSRYEIYFDLTVRGVPLSVILDTGVDPSVISMARADSLDLRIDRASKGEASGYGDSTSAGVFPATIDGLQILGHSFADVEALAADTTRISQRFGRDVDGVLGYSFLKDKIILIDYAAQSLQIIDRIDDSSTTVRSCRKHWSTPLQFLNGDNTPIIARFRLGSVTGPVTLDTGSNGGISLFDRAVDSPAASAALHEQGEEVHTGARGDTKSQVYSLNASAGFGPFSIPAGQTVNRIHAESKDDTRLANVGNRIFAQMKLKIMLNYRAKKLTFYGSCRP